MAKAKSFDELVQQHVVEIESQPAPRSIGDWIPDWVLAFAVAQAISALRKIASSETAKKIAKKSFLLLFNGIRTAYADDEDFACD